MFNIPEVAFWQDLEFDQAADFSKVSSGVDTVGIRVFVGLRGEESIDSSSDVAVGCGEEVEINGSTDGATFPPNTISVTAIAIRRTR
jgi:hypothetical protein